MVVIYMLKEEDGQAMVEFALTITIYLIFVLGLISIIWWITSAFFAQQMAHESARKYAVTQNKTEAEQLGKTYLSTWANAFIYVSETKVVVEKQDDTIAKSIVTVKPRFPVISFFGYGGYNVGTISREAHSFFTDFIRKPDKYRKY